MQRSLTGFARSRWPNRRELHQRKRGRSSVDCARKTGSTKGAGCGASAFNDSGELGSSVQRRNGEGATGQVGGVRFSAVKEGRWVRLRSSETYRRGGSCRLDVGDLVFDRSLGRPRNAVVLPEGWYLTASATPATVSLLPDGRVRLNLWNGSPDPADVLIKGRRRAGSAEKKP